MSFPAPSSAALSQLCAACGLCCNGVMFHTVRLQPGDAPRALVALGLKLKRRRGADVILQPCPALRAAGGEVCCSIYAQRPERCRVFACRQLQRVGAGEITAARALEQIAEAQQRVARLDELSRRADGSLRKGPLAQRCETALAEPFDHELDPARVQRHEEMARGLAALKALLDAEFRLPPAD